MCSLQKEEEESMSLRVLTLLDVHTDLSNKCYHRTNNDVDKENLVGFTCKTNGTRIRMFMLILDLVAELHGSTPITYTQSNGEPHTTTTKEHKHISFSMGISTGSEVHVAHDGDLKASSEPWEMETDSALTGYSLPIAVRKAKKNSTSHTTYGKIADESHNCDGFQHDLFDSSSALKTANLNGHMTTGYGCNQRCLAKCKLHQHIKRDVRDNGFAFSEQKDLAQLCFDSPAPRSRSSSYSTGSESHHVRTSSSQSLDTVLTTPHNYSQRQKSSIIDTRLFHKQLCPAYLLAPLNGPLASLLNDCLEIRNGVKRHQRPNVQSQEPMDATDIYRDEIERNLESINAWESKCASWTIQTSVQENNRAQSWEGWL